LKQSKWFSKIYVKAVIYLIKNNTIFGFTNAVLRWLFVTDAKVVIVHN